MIRPSLMILFSLSLSLTLKWDSSTSSKTHQPQTFLRVLDPNPNSKLNPIPQKGITNIFNSKSTTSLCIKTFLTNFSFCTNIFCTYIFGPKSFLSKIVLRTNNFFLLNLLQQIFLGPTFFHSIFNNQTYRTKIFSSLSN